MANYSRTDRVSEEIKRELSAIIRDLKDPRLPQMVSVVSVRVTKDLKFAKANISVMGDEKLKRMRLQHLKVRPGILKKRSARD